MAVIAYDGECSVGEARKWAFVIMHPDGCGRVTELIPGGLTLLHKGLDGSEENICVPARVAQVDGGAVVAKVPLLGLLPINSRERMLTVKYFSSQSQREESISYGDSGYAICTADVDIDNRVAALLAHVATPKQFR